jgi:transcriptional regulator with XRE-family HTH domain
MTQEELANRVGYSSKTTINKIEQGVNDVPQNKIVKFADCLKTSPSVLMGWVDEPTSKKNDTLASIVLQLRKDEELLEMVEALAELTLEKRQAVKSVLNAFSTTEK